MTKNKKIIISLCAVALIAIIVIIFAIAQNNNFKPLATMPDTNAPVLGQGGISVQKGEYLYFVDSYLDEKDLSSKNNKYGNVTSCAIYRTKLQNNALAYDENGKLKDMELVVPKIVGTSKISLYIIDDYIYYTTPYMGYDTSKTLRTDLVEFYRAKLNGDDVEKIYTTKNYSSNADYAFYKIGSNVYLALFDGKDIISVKMGKNIEKPVTLVENVTSASLYKYTSYNFTETNNDVCVYYTRAIKDNEVIETSSKGNVLGAVYVASGEIAKEYIGSESYEINYVQNGSVYVTKNVNENKTIWAYSSNLLSSTQITYTDAYSKVMLATNGIVFTYEGKTIWLPKLNDFSSSIEVSSSALDIAYIKDDYIYYFEDTTSLYRVKLIVTDTNYEVGEEELVVSDENMDKKYIDYDSNGYIFYYSTYTGDKLSAKYLNAINLNEKVQPTEEQIAEAEENGEDVNYNLGYSIKLVGNLKDEHIKTVQD